MSSVCKRRKGKRTRHVETSTMVVHGEDRISKLPEDVIIHILAFLETQYAVRTSALSKRWKNLYNSVPSIIFHLSDIDKNKDAGSNFLKQSISFVDRRLNSLPCGHLIHKFIFTRHRSMNVAAVEHVKDWSNVVIRAGVQQLCLDSPFWSPCQDIAGLFNCETLVELKLGHKVGGWTCDWGVALYLPRVIHLPNLKILHLCLCEISVDVAERLFTNFPLLESLTLLANCSVSGEFTINISSSNLKHLEFEINAKLDDCKYEVVINAPVLSTLFIDGSLGCFRFTNPLSVEEVRIGSGRNRFIDLSKRSDMLRLLVEISRVKYLQLTVWMFNSWMVKILDYCKGHQDWLYFPNLTRLEVGGTRKSHVLDLLRRTPNLEYLKMIDWFFEIFGADEDAGGDGEDDDDNDVPSCLSSHMKVIEVKHNSVWRSHMQLVEYLLKKAKVLHTVVFDCERMYHMSAIHSGEIKGPEDYLLDMKGYRTEIRAYQTKILECPRASQTCRIKFLGAMDTYPLEELW